MRRNITTSTLTGHKSHKSLGRIGGKLPLTTSGKYAFGPGINSGTKPKSRNLVTINTARTLHDPSEYWDNKMDRSTPYFHNTRV